jgi:hypothetical protein
MGNLVINVRGTNGSGKTTLVKNILRAFDAQPVFGIRDMKEDKKKIRGYVCENVNGKPLYILGAYETPTGGCDGIPTQDDICNLVREWAPKGNVLFEGLLISGLFRRYNDLADELEDHHFIFGFLDTPLQKCIDRTLARRAERRAKKGDTQTIDKFDPMKTLAPKFEAIKASRRKFEAAGSANCECCKFKPCKSKEKDVRNIPHTLSVETVIGWLL